MIEQQQPEVVIVDKNGKEHIFPAGFDPQRAAQIVRQQTGEEEPPSRMSMIAAGPGAIPSVANTREVVQDVGTTIKENPGTTGAMAAGIAAAPFTGGMSVPAMMALEGGAAAAGHAGGRLLGDVAQGKDIDLTDTAKDAALEGALSGVSAGVGPALKATGRGLYHLALKPRLAMSHTPEQVATLVKTGLDEGISVSTGGFQKAGRLIGEEAEQVRKLIRSLDATADVQRGLQKIAGLRAKWLKSGALDEKIAALDDVAEQYMRRYEGEMPLEELHNLKQGIWHETQNNWDKSLNPAKIEAQKAFGSGLREEIEQVGKARGVDDIGTRNERIGRLGDLQNVISGRAAHEAAPGLRQAVEMVGGASPGYLMRAVATSSPVLSRAARTVHAVGNVLDPRALSPAASHAPTGVQPKRTPVALLPAHPTELGPAPDPSFVRGVPAPGNPRPVRGALPPARDIIELGPSPDGSFVQSVPGEKTPWTLDQLGVPGPPGAQPSDILDRLDIPEMKEMYSPEELWEIKQMVERNPKLVHLPFQKWKQLLKETAESGTYRSKVEGQPNVRITKDKVKELYSRYLQTK